MRSKTYRASTMKEALARVRVDLGGDAIILAAREVRRRRLFGMGPRQLVEVTASDSLPASSRDTAQPRGLDSENGEDKSGLAGPGVRARIGDELGRIHASVSTLAGLGRIDHLVSELPGELVPAYCRLLEADVSEPLARRLIRHVADELRPEEIGVPGSVMDAVIGAVGLCIPVVPPIRAIVGVRRVIALVGPTGVGKTTTIAKLAAGFRLTHGARVGLVTVDTYRIAAVEQLRTYAEIIDVPLTVAEGADDLARAIDDLGPVDLIFVDTAGRSPRDEVRIRELTEILGRVRPDEIHLVLSVAAGERTLRAASERFDQVGADRLILTKLDEAVGLGAILGMLSGRSVRPISYLTTGQSVPDDIEPADRRRLARLLLEAEQDRS